MTFDAERLHRLRAQAAPPYSRIELGQPTQAHRDRAIARRRSRRAAARRPRRAGTAPADGAGALIGIAQLEQRRTSRTMFALGGSGRAAPKEEVRVWTHSRPSKQS